MRSTLSLLPVAFAALATAHQPRVNHHALAKRANGDLLDKRDTYNGARWTFYSTGLGACGGTNKDSDYIVALNQDTFGNDYPSQYCNKQITMTYNGKTTTATIVDSCPGCPSNGGLDLSPGLFSFFADQSEGVIYGDWSFTDGSGGGSGGDTTTTTKKTTTTPPPPPPTTTHTTPKETPTTTEAPPPPKVTTTSTKETTTSTKETTSSAKPSSSAAAKPSSSSALPKPSSSSVAQVAPSSAAAAPTEAAPEPEPTTPAVVGNVATQPDAEPTSSVAAINGGLGQGTGGAASLSFSGALLGAVVFAVAAVQL
ncbi:RlpA-like double-psi beta-barrel-protein domain-containing protein-containing protein [Mycena galopus ATCC 62051]|nr:RlpA-like double-psi beta-barrel-protein domain-containing protein-containing protein [Mycena galopus ATCC 62051]